MFFLPEVGIIPPVGIAGAEDTCTDRITVGATAHAHVYRCIIIYIGTS